MACKIFEETGQVPLDCLFDCKRGCVHKASGAPDSKAHCHRCGSTDVRWRQQGGQWVLFSLEPGVEHTCPIDDSAFTASE